MHDRQRGWLFRSYDPSDLGMRLFGYSEIFLNKDFSVEDVQRIRLERVVRHVLVQMLYIGIALIFVLLIYPFDLGKDAPAWVQAVGSIAGIGVAIWIPIRIQAGQERRIERDRVLRTKAFAIAFQPLIEKFRGGPCAGLGRCK